ncbi:MAG: DUF4214 domain-containing protein, partial [Lachnospiraceae bacterium]|nr:DUF4214 domain-containing protein [Lachnospiraceae bacterium]
MKRKRFLGFILALAIIMTMVPYSRGKAYAIEPVFEVHASITAPMPGNCMDIMPTSGDEDKYTVSVEWESPNFLWYRGFSNSSFLDPGVLMYDSETYIKDRIYYVVIRFTAQPGYYFETNEDSAFLNGKKGHFFKYDDANHSVSYMYRFVCRKPVEVFVERLYNICLGREPDTEGFNYWVGLLESGEKTG